MNIKSALIYSSNLGIRGITISIKFLFTLFLGKYYSEDVLGGYGLFATTVLISFFVLSLSFDSYATREIIQKPRDEQMNFIRNLFVFFIASWLIFVPIAFILTSIGWIDKTLIFYFLVILLFETFSQVFFSLFTILQQSIAANIILFLSQASWVLVFFVIHLAYPVFFISLDRFLLVWIFGGVIACCYGFYKIRRLYPSKLSIDPINWKWIKSGITVSLLFFFSTLGYKIIEFADRYFIEFKLGTAKVGVYIFYSQIANLMNTVINVTVVLMLYPRLIENFAKRDLDAFITIRNKMYQRVIFIGLTVFVVAILFIKMALVFIGKESFYSEIHVFYILLLANLAMNLSFVPHYCLFAMRNDKTLLVTTVTGTICCIVLNLFLIDIFGVEGAAVSTGLSFCLVWILKSIYASKRKIVLSYEGS